MLCLAVRRSSARSAANAGSWRSTRRTRPRSTLALDSGEEEPQRARWPTAGVATEGAPLRRAAVVRLEAGRGELGTRSGDQLGHCSLLQLAETLPGAAKAVAGQVVDDDPAQLGFAGRKRHPDARAQRPELVDRHVLGDRDRQGWDVCASDAPDSSTPGRWRSTVPPERLSRKFFQVKRYICYTLPLSNAKIYAWPVTMTQQAVLGEPFMET